MAPHVRERSNRRDESSTVPVEDTSSTRINAGIRLASIDGRREGVTYVCDEINVRELQFTIEILAGLFSSVKNPGNTANLTDLAVVVVVHGLGAVEPATLVRRERAARARFTHYVGGFSQKKWPSPPVVIMWWRSKCRT